MESQKKLLFDRNAQPERDRLCARIIVSDPVRYPGLMQEWASKVLAKETPKR